MGLICGDNRDTAANADEQPESDVPVDLALSTQEQIPLIVLQGEETTSWTPDEETVNFDPAVLGYGYTLPPFDNSDTQMYRMYTQTKMLASYIGRMELTGHDVKSVARNIWLNLRGEFDSGSRALQAVSGDLSRYAIGVEPNLYRSFYLHISIVFHDMVKRNPRHKCFRDECQMYCILPVYARRCLSDTKVHGLMYRIRRIVEQNQSLLVSRGRTTESKSALNIFRHLVELNDPTLYYLYDVLLAMIGDQETLMNPRAKIDSKLYASIFDLIRKNDYDRFQEDYCRSLRIEDLRKTGSLPWLANEYGSFQEEFRSALHLYRAMQNLGASVTEPSAPPTYESVITIPQPLPTDTDDGLPSYEQVLNEMVNVSEN